MLPLLSPLSLSKRAEALNHALLERVIMMSPSPNDHHHRLHVETGNNGNGHNEQKNGSHMVGRYAPLTPSPSKYRRNGSTTKRNFFICAMSLTLICIGYLYMDYTISQSIVDMIGLRGDRGGGITSDSTRKAHAWGKGVEPGSVKSISVLGERNSGTTWVYDHLGQCFNHTVPVRRRLSRYKHWFQHETDRKDRQYEGSLVLAQFRNIFEWTRAMQATPHHAPAHLDIKDWREYVTKTWTMKRFGKDLNMTDDEKSGRAGPICQEGFYYRDVITCHVRPYPDGYWDGKKHKHRFSEHQPFYEMRSDGSGEPYDNVLEMRAAKIYNFLNTTNFPWVEDMWVLRYEDLLKEGTANLIKSIEKVTGVKSNCTASPPQNRKKREIDKGLRKYLLSDKNVDWKAERMIGYTKND
mmetsp:Transcript_7340/g.15346  ORF Transcript_7340/g.15346 Transcript_7340/m.15346 type:complete len:409 (-) Transcript_7340:105-1331(-)